MVNVSTILEFVLFADDTNLASHENLARLIKNINQEMTKVVNWLKINKLSLNIKKLTTFYFVINGKKLTYLTKLLKSMVHPLKEFVIRNF